MYLRLTPRPRFTGGKTGAQRWKPRNHGPGPAPPHQAVALQRLDERGEGVGIEHEPLRHVLDEVQVFVGGDALFFLLLAGPPLVRGALEVELEVHLDHARQHVVHHHHANVLPARLHTVQPVELGQQRPWVLVEVLGGRGSAEMTPGAVPAPCAALCLPHRSQARGHLLRKPTVTTSPRLIPLSTPPAP